MHHATAGRRTGPAPAPGLFFYFLPLPVPAFPPLPVLRERVGVRVVSLSTHNSLGSEFADPTTMNVLKSKQMKPSLFHPACFLTTILLFAPLAHAADEDAPFEQQKAQMKQEAESEAQQLKAINAEKIEDVVRFSIEGNDLTLKSKLEPTDGYVRLNVTGLNGFAKVLVTTPNGGGGGASAFNLIQQDFSPADAMIVLTTVFSVPHNLHVSRDEDRLDERRNIQMIQSDQYTADGEGKIKLYINISKKMTGETVADLKLSAANILELRRKHPLEVAKYIEPIFRDLKQEAILGQVDPKLAWQVFAPLFVPTPQLQAQVKSLIKRMDAESFADREAASADLQKLNPAAAMVLARMSRAGMSDEQQTRIDALVAPYKPVPDDEAVKLHTDKFFLLDCLYCEDLQVRTWAVGELKKVLGPTVPIAFDVSAPADQREKAVSRLRATVLGATTLPTRVTAPATKPASSPPPSSPAPRSR